ncbi:MAG: tetratricopeptide repeat protein [Gammaproteobacteria bacterium]
MCADRVQQDQPPSQAGQERVVSLDEAFQLAFRLQHQGRLHEAEALYRQILQVAPEHADALHFLGILCYQLNQGEEAVELIRRAVTVNPDYTDAHSNLGNVLKARGDLEGAEAAYRRALELNPEHANAWNNLGVIRRQQGRLQEAEQACRKAVALNPALVDTHYNLGGVWVQQNRLGDAAGAFREVLARNPKYIEAYKALGMCLYRLGDLAGAREVYQNWLALMPGHPVALHMLATCSGEAPPDRASDAYVTSLFDAFAEDFDAHLARLDYCAPQLIATALAAAVSAPARDWDVLDAGCGTGLCGPLLRPYARRLVGVDLSPGMLERARPRKVYDDLQVAELTAFLESQGDAYDVIVSADTLVYFGALDEVLDAAYHALRPGGRLLFTVERTDDATADGFQITRSGRYSHRRAYIERCLSLAGFDAIAIQEVTPRYEHGEPVRGYLVSAHR